MRESLLRAFLHHLDPDERIVILRSSQDPGLRRMFAVFGGLGSTHLDVDGKIYVQIDDARGASKAIWLEELAHARQCMLDGSPEASSDMAQICDREIEVHQCLLANASRLKLTPTEIAECEAQLQHYTEMKNDKRRRR